VSNIWRNAHAPRRCGWNTKSNAQAPAIAADVAAEMPELSPSQYGTEVHWRMKNEITSLGRPDLKTEYSVVGDRSGDYGELGSTRFDIYQLDDVNNRVCIYDIVTGSGSKRTSDFQRQYKAAYDYRPTAQVLLLQLDAPRP
jgi:hypothetical protein